MYWYLLETIDEKDVTFSVGDTGGSEEKKKTGYFQKGEGGGGGEEGTTLKNKVWQI